MSKKNIGIEEIQKIMQENNLSFSDIAKLAAGLNNGIVGEEKVNTESINKKPEVTFELTSQSYPDFTVTKTTPTQTKILVVAPSCNGFFIKSKTGKQEWKIEELTEKAYASFMQGYKDQTLKFEDDFWIDKLQTGEKYWSCINDYLSINGIRNMLRDHCAPKFKRDQFGLNGNRHADASCDIRSQILFYNAMPILYKEYYKDARVGCYVNHYPAFIYTVYKRFGLDKARDYLEEAKISLQTLQGYSYYTSIRNVFCYDNPNSPIESKYYISIGDNNIGFDPASCSIPFMEMDFDCFKEYCLYESYRMGYQNIRTMFDEWNDCLKQQMELYGKIREKYPSNLQTYHAKLSQIMRVRRDYIEEDMVAKASEAAQSYAWDMPKEWNYTFLIPKKKDDFYDEASQQANCLAGYVGKFAMGDCIIVFMREKETPDTSCVTIEIVEGIITQAYRKSNKPVSYEENDAIKEYAKKFHLIYRGVKY